MPPNAPMLATKTRPEGVPHRVLGVIFEVFEALGGLGRFGRVLRPVLHGSWEEKVANMAPSWPPKSSQHRCYLQEAFFEKTPFFFRKKMMLMVPGMEIESQNRSKIHPKIDPERDHFFDRFLHRCFIDFCSTLGANLEPCSPLFPPKSRK